MIGTRVGFNVNAFARYDVGTGVEAGVGIGVGFEVGFEVNALDGYNVGT